MSFYFYDSDTVFKIIIDLNYIKKIVKPGVTLHHLIIIYQISLQMNHPYGFYVIHNEDALKLLENWDSLQHMKKIELDEEYKFKKLIWKYILIH